MGCRVCRARKVKCDGRPNGCRNCERLQLDCVGENGSASGLRTSAVALRKIRTYRSCASCRASKTKCDGDRPKCSRCTSKQLECVYDGGTTPRWARNLDGNPTSLSPEGPWQASSQVNQGEASGGAEKHDGSILLAQGQLSQSDDPSVAGAMTVGGSNVQGHPDAMVLDRPPDTVAWLLSHSLPTTRNLRRIVEHYFANVHPLRCFAFIHKPSFMRQLDHGFESDDESALLHIVCAQGAKYHVLSLAQADQPVDTAFLRAAGSQWARKAEFLMLGNFGKVSIHRLMTAVLLHDYYFRLGEYSQALMISGLAVRMAHALKINTEYSVDIMCIEPNTTGLSIASRESRRRLMWACYVLDAWTGGGVDQLTLLRENDIKIQLPCNERNFGLRIASVTETLGVGHVLQFLPPAVVPRRPAANMGIMAYYIRVVTLWKRIVRYVNHIDSGPPPWLPESEFALLLADLKLWRTELPDFVEYSDETIYARLDSNQLGALVLIHCTYHHNYLELNKICMPDLFKLRKPCVFPPTETEFVQGAQADSYFHARQISNILRGVAEHGLRLFSDALLPFFVFESSRVMLYYIARLLDPGHVSAEAKVFDTLRAVESNNDLMKMMAPLFPVAETLSLTVERWLFKIRSAMNQQSGSSSSGLIEGASIVDPDLASPTTANQTTGSPEYVLPSLSLHRLAGNAVTPVSGRSRDGSGASPPEKEGEAGDTSWSAENPNAAPGTSWDHTSAAHGLVGLSRDTFGRPGLQHERPVAQNPRIKPGGPSGTGGMYESLQVDDLQDFLSWDVYGMMSVEDNVSTHGTEETGTRGS